MRINPKDVVSYAGRDYIVEGTATYHLGGKSFLLARAVDGEIVFWIEALRDEADDRLLVLREIRDLEINVPPPESIAYHDVTYVRRLTGRANVEMGGDVPDRSSGATEVWRYRAAGDLFLQIERWPDRTVKLFGESVHKSMVDVLPAP